LRLICILLICMAFAQPVFAADIDTELADLIGADSLVDGLTEEQNRLIDHAHPMDSPNFIQSMLDLLSKAIADSGGMVRDAASQASILLAICLLCGLCGTMERAPPVQVVVMCGVLCIVIVCAESVRGIIRDGTDTIRNLNAYAQLQLPVMAAAAVSSGSVVSAPAIYSLTVLFTDFLFTFIVNGLVPLLYAFLALAMGNCLLSNSMLKRMKELVGWFIKTGLKSMLYIFSAFMTLTQVISGTADAMTTKAAKLTISSVVPVVGSIISDASETVLVSAGMIRNSVGVFGLLAISAICIMPFLQIGISYLMLKITGAVSGLVAQDTLVSMIDAVAEAEGMLLAMTGTGALLLLISTVCSLKVVGY